MGEKVRVAVVFGGRSAEHAISSAQEMACSALRPANTTATRSFSPLRAPFRLVGREP